MSVSDALDRSWRRRPSRTINSGALSAVAREGGDRAARETQILGGSGRAGHAARSVASIVYPLIRGFQQSIQLGGPVRPAAAATWACATTATC